MKSAHFIALFLGISSAISFSGSAASNEAVNLPFLSWLQAQLAAKPTLPPLMPTQQQSALVCGMNKYPIENAPPAYTGPARLNEAPWLVRIIDANTYRWFCDGAIVGSRAVLTAASCIENHRKYEIVVADHAFGSSEQGETTLPIAKVVLHPAYSQANKRNDFAILLTAADIPMDRNAVRQICLPASGDHADYVGSTVAVFGWSATLPIKSTFLQKQISNHLVKPIADCQKLYQPRDEKIHIAANDTICAGSGTSGELCNTDLGGALVELKHGRHYLIGVASVIGHGCNTRAKLPTVFGRVAPIIPWIFQTQNGNGIVIPPPPPFVLETVRPPVPPTRPPSVTSASSPASTLGPSSGSNTGGADLSAPQCGITKYMEETRKATVRIIGGGEAKINQVPWQVRVLIRGSLCGGTIIHRRVVLTAAHCAGMKTLSSYKLIVGDHTTTAVDVGEHTLEVAKVIVHEGYNEATHRNDFALLITAKDIPFNSVSIRPACLPTKSSQETYAGWEGHISGWGRITTDNTRVSNVLKIATVSIYNNNKCGDSYRSRYWWEPGIDITSEMVCAAGPRTDTCQGDSGGPLTVLENGRHTLIGVTSFGRSCGSDQYPGVYARVASALDWLEQSMRSQGLIGR